MPDAWWVAGEKTKRENSITSARNWLTRRTYAVLCYITQTLSSVRYCWSHSLYTVSEELTKVKLLSDLGTNSKSIFGSPQSDAFTIVNRIFLLYSHMETPFFPEILLCGWLERHFWKTLLTFVFSLWPSSGKWSGLRCQCRVCHGGFSGSNHSADNEAFEKQSHLLRSCFKSSVLAVFSM